MIRYKLFGHYPLHWNLVNYSWVTGPRSSKDEMIGGTGGFKWQCITNCRI